MSIQVRQLRNHAESELLWGHRKLLPLPQIQPYLVEIFRSCPHFLPCLVQELDTDAEKLLEGSVVGEEHWVEVVAGLTGWKREFAE